MTLTAPSAPTTTSSAATPTGSGSARRHPVARVGATVAGLVLDALALLGVVCIALVIAAYGFHVTLIMFKTGSMTPTIPTGSLALVREIPASELHVGDVATVERGTGQLPVTHRVTQITPGPDGRVASVTMKGDANDAEDPSPYQIDHARKVIWSHAGLGYLVARVQNPKIMGVVTMGLALLVTWAFWPRTKKEL